MILNKKPNVREEILRLLINPLTPTELKNRLSHIKSFGTIAYHLNKLEEEHIITKEKLKDKQGQPTKYTLASKLVRSNYEKIDKLRQDYLLAFLKYVRDNPDVEDGRMIRELKEQGYDEDGIGDISLDGSYKSLTTLRHRITQKGEKFLRDNEHKNPTS
jgi:DNA-binding transcriptional ArsR family regulator